MLLRCIECGSEVSEYAEKCLSCGCPVDIIKQSVNQCNDKITYWHGNKTIDITGIRNRIPEEDLNNYDVLRSVLLQMAKDLNFNGSDIIVIEEVIKFNNYKFPTNFQETYDAMCAHNQASINASKVHCPYCNSSNVKKIGVGGRILSTATLGLAGKVGKQWHCNSCKSDF